MLARQDEVHSELCYEISDIKLFSWNKKERSVSIWNPHKRFSNDFFGIKVNPCILRYITSGEPKGPTIVVPTVSLNSKEKISAFPEALFILIVSKEPNILGFYMLEKTQAISYK